MDRKEKREVGRKRRKRRRRRKRFYVYPAVVEFINKVKG